MTARTHRSGIALFALAAAILLASCKEEKPAPRAESTELTDLASAAELWAGRAEMILRRGWAARLQFRARLFARVQALRTFNQEVTTPPVDQATPRDRLVERGRNLLNRADPSDTALALLERLAPPLDQITGLERVIAIHMQPLETRGEAPFRLRVTNFEKEVTLGFTHLDEALARTLADDKDAKLHENIAIAALRGALESATRLAGEVKKSAALAGAAVDRRRMLDNRIAWAEGIAAKLDSAVPADAVEALADARRLAGTLPAETDAVLDSIRNAESGADTRADALGRRAEAVIERLTRAFLDSGRKAGVADPK